jgi:hypothetical protein
MVELRSRNIQQNTVSTKKGSGGTSNGKSTRPNQDNVAQGHLDQQLENITNENDGSTLNKTFTMSAQAILDALALTNDEDEVMADTNQEDATRNKNGVDEDTSLDQHSQEENQIIIHPTLPENQLLQNTRNQPEVILPQSQFVTTDEVKKLNAKMWSNARKKAGDLISEAENCGFVAFTGFFDNQRKEAHYCTTSGLEDCFSLVVDNDFFQLLMNLSGLMSKGRVNLVTQRDKQLRPFSALRIKSVEWSDDVVESCGNKVVDKIISGLSFLDYKDCIRFFAAGVAQIGWGDHLVKNKLIQWVANEGLTIKGKIDGKMTALPKHYGIYLIIWMFAEFPHKFKDMRKFVDKELLDHLTTENGRDIHGFALRKIIDIAEINITSIKVDVGSGSIRGKYFFRSSF